MFTRRPTATNGRVTAGHDGLRPRAQIGNLAGNSRRFGVATLTALVASVVAVAGFANPATAHGIGFARFVSASDAGRVVSDPESNSESAMVISTQWKHSEKTMTYRPLTHDNMGEVGFWAKRNNGGTEYGMPTGRPFEETAPLREREFSRFGVPIGSAGYRPPGSSATRQGIAVSESNPPSVEPGAEAISCGTARLDLDNVAGVATSYTLDPRFGTIVAQTIRVRAEIWNRAGDHVTHIDTERHGNGPNDELEWDEYLEDLGPLEIQIGSQFEAKVSGWVLTKEGSICSVPEFTSTLKVTKSPDWAGNPDTIAAAKRLGSPGEADSHTT